MERVEILISGWVSDLFPSVSCRGVLTILAKFQHQGLIRHIGLSNVAVAQRRQSRRYQSSDLKDV